MNSGALLSILILKVVVASTVFGGVAESLHVTINVCCPFPIALLKSCEKTFPFSFAKVVGFALSLLYSHVISPFSSLASAVTSRVIFESWLL